MHVRRRLYHRLPAAARRRAARILGLPRHGAFEVRVSGQKITLLDPGRASLLREFYLFGDETPWERGPRSLVVHLLRQAEQPLMVDAGAYLGAYTLLAKAANSRTRVVAFEPAPANADYLQRVLRLNGTRDVVVERAALADREGEATLFIPQAGRQLPDTASLVDRFRGSGGTFEHETAARVRVPVTSLDRYAKEHDLGRLDLLKVDVEEGELALLRGAEQALRAHAPDVICEVLMTSRAKAEVFTFLTGLGYRAHLITHAGLVPEERPLTLPRPDAPGQALWLEHYFTHRDENEARRLSEAALGAYFG